jgi:hypothetical protein
MQTNLHLYHRVLERLSQWLPEERVTRQRNLALLVAGLYLSGSVHLAMIVRKWPSRSKEPSLVNRLNRFLNNSHVKVRKWYEPLAESLLSRCSGGQIHLVIDCTKVGFNYRLMTVGIAYKRRVLPLVWSVHCGSRGHTSAKKQIELFAYVGRLMPAQSEVWVLGDSEFQSVSLLRWLRCQRWHFFIRQRGAIKVSQTGESWTKINQFDLAPGRTRYLGWVQLTEKHGVGWFWLILHWESGEDEPWYLVSDCQGQRRLLNRYRVRMWIEEMYGDMKGHGFDLEATHLDDPDRVSHLVLAVSFAFVWLIAIGSWVVKRGLRHYVDHKSRRDKSYFRIGWDWIERCLRLNDPVPLRFITYS